MFQFFKPFALVAYRVGKASDDDVFVPPIVFNDTGATLNVCGIKRQYRTRFELEDVFVNRIRRRHVAEAQEQRHDVAIDCVVKTMMGAERLELRAKNKRG